MPLVGRLSQLLLAAALALLVVLGAAVGTQASQQPAWEMRAPVNPRQTGTFQHPKLTESSGVIASRHQPGLLWTMNDSGNEPLIFATDTLGRDHGAFLVAGAENEDWEAISLGPCGTGECLYIADTGDNLERRASVRLYRVPEPPLHSRLRRTRRAEALELRYPDGPRDVEAMFVGRDGTVYLISKGRNGVIEGYRVPASAWKATRTVAEPIGSLPIETGELGALVTDAALAPSGDLVAVRTYLAIFLFRLEPRHTLRALGAGCPTGGLQLQGEGITWLDDEELALTSEAGFGRRGTLVLLQCQPH